MASPSSPVVLLTGDPIGARMAGPAIRTVELARALSDAGIEVVVAAPAVVGGAPVGLDVRTAEGEPGVRRAVAGASAVVAFSAVVAEHPWLGSSGVPLVVDAYDPGLLETLERFRGAPVNEQRGWLDDARRHLVEPLAVADLVLVASERQRLYTLGLLTAAGRVNARVAAEDPSLGALCRVVPFGVQAAPPQAERPGPLRSGPGAVPDDAVVALWGGGLYDWLDPLLLVEAVARCPDPRVVGVFLAGPHPTAAVGPLPLVERARRRADELGLGSDRVRFVEEWVPYGERGAWLVDADIGVSLHGDHLETTFAFRTRVLDYLWAGLPVVVSAGDHLAEVVAERAIGCVVPVGDADAVAEALAVLAAAPADEVARRRERIGALAGEHRWGDVVQPLVEWCQRPRLAADRRVVVERPPRSRGLIRRARG